MEPSALERWQARVGTVLREKWKLDRLLGVGGMAAVYAATHKMGRRDAVKILHPEVARSPELRARFEQEARAATKLGHPGVVEIRDIDTAEDGSPFLVMELLEGESLAQRAERAPVTAEELFKVMDEVLDVLAVAHGAGVVHRDIKPDNLFLCADGRVMVLDFGIARVQDGKNLTRTGSMLGTVSYMAPEQVRGKGVDGRSDLFSVGATLFRILAKRKIHVTTSEGELAAKMATVPAPSLGSVAEGIDPRVVRVVDRALAFDQGARYADARAMQADVRAVLRGEDPPNASPPPVSLAPATKPLPKGRSPLARSSPEHPKLQQTAKDTSLGLEPTAVPAPESAPISINVEPDDDDGWGEPSVTKPLPPEARRAVAAAIEAPKAAAPAKAETPASPASKKTPTPRPMTSATRISASTPAATAKEPASAPDPATKKPAAAEPAAAPPAKPSPAPSAAPPAKPSPAPLAAPPAKPSPAPASAAASADGPAARAKPPSRPPPPNQPSSRPPATSPSARPPAPPAQPSPLPPLAPPAKPSPATPAAAPVVAALSRREPGPLPPPSAPPKSAPKLPRVATVRMEPTSSGPLPLARTKQRAREAERQRKQILIAAAVGGAVILGVLIMVFAGSGDSSPTRASASATAEPAPPPPAPSPPAATVSAAAPKPRPAPPPPPPASTPEPSAEPEASSAPAPSASPPPAASPAPTNRPAPTNWRRPRRR